MIWRKWRIVGVDLAKSCEIWRIGVRPVHRTPLSHFFPSPLSPSFKLAFLRARTARLYILDNIKNLCYNYKKTLIFCEKSRENAQKLDKN